MAIDLDDPRTFRRALLLLFLGSLVVRLFGLDWDQSHSFHPDERRITEAVLQMSFSPLQLNPNFFAYGSLPFYVNRIVCSLLGNVSPWFLGWDGVLHTGRALSAAWGALAVLLVALLGRRLLGARAGLLAGALLGGAVFHVQNSHFATNDVPLTTLVLLTLLLLVRAVERGGAAAFALAGAAAGLAFATKASAVTLVLPILAAAVLAGVRARSLDRAVGAGAAGLLAFAGFFALGQPYALVDPAAFLRDVAEQGRMVRDAGSVPYTNQYVHVPKVLYELREIVVWGLGPALGLAALAGVAVRLRKLFRDRDPREAILWVWALPFFAVTASFDVKFPRYLLPLYPLLALAAASLLRTPEGDGPLRRALRRFVLAVSAVYLVAFLSIYTRPHTIVMASEWFHENVAPGSTVAIQDWDEGFPFSLPDRPAERYRIETLPFYDVDGPGKISSLAARLSGSDVLVLQTKRLYGAINQAADRFPLTDRLFQRLFAGDLGFDLVKDFSSAPGLLGVRLPTELADESFSVYDHPKALVFRNSGRLGAAEIESRVLSAEPSRPVTRREMLLARADGRFGSDLLPSGTRSSPVALLVFAALLQLLGWCAWRLLGPRLPAVPGVYAFAKVAGVVGFGVLSLLLVVWGPFRFDRGFLVLVLVVLSIVAARATRRPQSPPPRAEVFRTEAAFWGVFLVFAGIRALAPEIHWGEKPMDFSILNALFRSELLPPPEPWFAGTTLSYAWFGHYLVAALGKAAFVHPALAFNLGIAAFAALTGAGLLAAGAFLGRRLRTGVLALVLGLLAGNLSGLRELAQRRSIDFDLFWATSRVLKDTINEFPLWSFVFADLHSHLLAFPISLGLLGALLLLARRRLDASLYRPPFSGVAILGVAALFLGALVMTNGWGTPTAAGLVLGLLAFGTLRPGEPQGHPARELALGRFATGVLGPGAAIAAGAAAVSSPFWIGFTPPSGAWGWEVGPWAGPVPFALIFGLFLTLLVPFLFLLWARALRDGSVPRAGIPVAVYLVAGAVLLGLSLLDPKALLLGEVAPAASIRVFAFGLASIGLLAAAAPGTGDRDATAALLAGYAFLVICGCEVVFLWDRMNTVFKYHLDAWLLLAVAGAVAAEVVFLERPKGPFRVAWRLLAGGAVVAAAATSVLVPLGALRTRRVEGPRFTLDGTAWLASSRPDDDALVRALNRLAPGLPTLAEAWGTSYGSFARLSMNTGLPIVVGWDYHLVQRGKHREDIQRRIEDVRTLFTSTSPAEIERVLLAYDVRFVASGRVETEAYGLNHRKTFRALPGLLRQELAKDGAILYRVTIGPPARPGGADSAMKPSAARAIARVEPVRADLGELKEPRGLAVGEDGTIYLADFGNSRIARFSSTLAPLEPLGSAGKGPGQLNQPAAVATARGGGLWVADTGNNRVQLLSPQGTPVRTIEGEFLGPRGVAEGPDGSVYVSDTGNDRVVRISANGQVEQTIGGKGSGPGSLSGPVGIVVDGGGNAFVCDNGNGRLKVFKPDGSVFASLPVDGWKAGPLSEPHIALDAARGIWVTVPLAGEVRLLDISGTVLETFSGKAPGPSLGLPLGIAVPSGGRVLVTDRDAGLVWLRSRPRSLR